jgi:tRNA-specific 2-thiouridylase
VRVLVAMSGGVDSSVAAALCVAAGHEVVGATLKLWGGPSDSGCCSVADVDDARRVAQQIGVPHHVFNLTDEFERDVVGPYVAEHARGRTPNPCIECNRHIKFDLLLERARRLGFDRLATGHHARVRPRGGHRDDGAHELRRGADPAKDQSYVLSMLGQAELASLLLPVGHLSKPQVRAEAARLGLRTATKPDSQDVCFIHGGAGRAGFLAERLELHPAAVVDDESGATLGEVAAVELVTVGQRRGVAAAGARRYAVDVDVARRRVTVAGVDRAVVDRVDLDRASLTWVAEPLADGSPAIAQTSAHGRGAPCTVSAGVDDGTDAVPADAPQRRVTAAGEARDVATTPRVLTVRFAAPQRPVAAGQTLALYSAADPDLVLGAGIVASARRPAPERGARAGMGR